MEGMPEPMARWLDVVVELIGTHGVDPTDREASLAAYERHIEAVRAEVPPERLVEWTTGDGWAPLCEALGLPVPDAPFPHVNTEAEFRRQNLGLDS
jgi:hypothetical protein